MAKRASFKLRKKAICSLAVLILLIGLFAWIYLPSIYENSTQVFYGMLNQSLSTSTYAKTVSEPSPGQDLRQYIVVQTGSKNLVGATTILKQTSTLVQTENVGSPTTDYARYTKIQTRQISSSGKPLNFSSVIGVWGSDQPAGSNITDGQLFNESVLGLIPIADLNLAQRSEIMTFIKTNKVYEIIGVPISNYSSGRLQYTFTIKVNPVAYVEMMKKFGTDIGLNQLSAINESSFSNIAAEFHVKVDAISKDLVSDSEVSSNRIETYSGFGAHLALSSPSKTIPISQLEEMLQAIH